MDNTLISRAVVQNEFRKVEDLVERIGGGAGPGGLKAVAPTGTEHIIITIPEEEQQVSILGEKLSVDGRDGTANYTSPGRAIAVISNVMIEYVPGPPAADDEAAADATSRRHRPPASQRDNWAIQSRLRASRQSCDRRRGQPPGRSTDYSRPRSPERTGPGRRPRDRSPLPHRSTDTSTSVGVVIHQIAA